MKRIHLSPVTSLLVSLSLVLGILVSDLTGLRVLSTVKAETTLIPVSAGRLASNLIEVKGVMVDGVATDALIEGGVGLGDAFIDSGCGVTPVGYTSTGDAVYAIGGFTGATTEGVFTSGNVNGVFTSGNVAGSDEGTTNGVFTSGNLSGDDEGGTNGVFTSGNVYVGDTLRVTGGSLSGTDVQVNNGVISGSDLAVVGSYVSGMCTQ